ncbi:lipopolysaccharide biosynthesis protein [Paludisphaera soli]|uniref:lipopolysaccharide biosynthesis protein n=1 Tax=Paludisphaera soli TaxID=2712865 RepID=UPI0013EC0A7E|nr:oligosaccharide flippase family protein [Paludisphaera soli]
MTKPMLVYLTGAMVLKAGGILLLPIFTRFLDPDDFGTLELLNRATDVLLLCLFANGSCLAVITFYNQATDEGRRRRIAATALLYGALNVAAVGLPGLLLAGPIGEWLGIGDASLVRLAFLGALSDALLLVCLSLVQARVESIRHTALLLAGFCLRLALIAALVGLGRMGVRGILYSTIGASSLLTTYLVSVEVRRSGFHPDLGLLWSMAKFALPFLPAGLCGFILGAGDQFLLSRYVDKAEVGFYALGCKMAVMVGAVALEPLMKVWGARMHVVARGEEAPRAFGRVFSRFSAMYLFVGLGLVLFSEDVILLLAGPRYLSAAGFITPVVVAYFFMGCGDLMDSAFYIRRRTLVKLWITLATTATTLALYGLLIPQYKAMGAAYATLGGFAFRLMVVRFVSQRLFAVEYEWGRLARIASTAAACWALSLAASGTRYEFSLKAASLAAFPIALWLTGCVTPEERQAVAVPLARLLRRVDGTRGRPLPTES